MIFESVVWAENGKAIFTNIGFIGTPGSKDNDFFLRSAAVDPNKIIEGFGE